jgi:hypothetical protein
VTNRASRLYKAGKSNIEGQTADEITHVLLWAAIQILLDAFTVEDVSALGLNSIFCDVITNATNRGLPDILGNKLCRVGFTSKDEIRMARHLPHSRQPIEI